MTIVETQTTIPPTLKPFFQEYTFERLDAEQHAELVIERTLAWGNCDELRWLFARYGRDRVASWVQRMGARRLPRFQLRFWGLVLEIDEHQITRAPRGIWPY